MLLWLLFFFAAVSATPCTDDLPSCRTRLQTAVFGAPGIPAARPPDFIAKMPDRDNRTALTWTITDPTTPGSPSLNSTTYHLLDT